MVGGFISSLCNWSDGKLNPGLERKFFSEGRADLFCSINSVPTSSHCPGNLVLEFLLLVHQHRIKPVILNVNSADKRKADQHNNDGKNFLHSANLQDCWQWSKFTETRRLVS